MAQLSETVGEHVVEAVPKAHPADTARAVRADLFGHRYEAVDAVYVVDDHGRLQGVVPLSELLVAPANRPLRQFMITNPPRVGPKHDRDQLARCAIRGRIAAVPVVDEAGLFLGVVPAQELVEMLRADHIEDLHQLAGTSAHAAEARSSLEAPPLHRLRERLPWLLVGLVGSVLMTTLMAGFEGALEARLAIAFFVPALVYLADAIGTQTETIAVRYLLLKQAPLGRLLIGELGTGILIGLALGAFIFPAVLLGFGDVRLAVAVTLAVVAASAVATVIGMALPWLLSRIGRDPAFGTPPLSTVIQDMLSLLIYFAIVTVLVM